MITDGVNLKHCPFCGGEVLFDIGLAFGRLHPKPFEGICTQCGMEFKYEERFENLKNDYEDRTVIYHNVVLRDNAPFDEAWNRRTPNVKVQD